MGKLVVLDGLVQGRACLLLIGTVVLTDLLSFCKCGEDFWIHTRSNG